MSLVGGKILKIKNNIAKWLQVTSEFMLGLLHPDCISRWLKKGTEVTQEKVNELVSEVV